MALGDRDIAAVHILCALDEMMKCIPYSRTTYKNEEKNAKFPAKSEHSFFEIVKFLLVKHSSTRIMHCLSKISHFQNIFVGEKNNLKCIPWKKN